MLKVAMLLVCAHAIELCPAPFYCTYNATDCATFCAASGGTRDESVVDSCSYPPSDEKHYVLSQCFCQHGNSCHTAASKPCSDAPRSAQECSEMCVGGVFEQNHDLLHCACPQCYLASTWAIIQEDRISASYWESNKHIWIPVIVGVSCLLFCGGLSVCLVFWWCHNFLHG